MPQHQPDLNHFTVGGATVSLSAPGRGRWATDHLARPFFGRRGDPILRISTSRLDRGAAPVGDVKFESARGWSISEGPSSWCVTFFNGRGRRGPVVHHFLEIDRSWRSAVFHLPQARTGSRTWPFFLGYPLERILFTDLLARSEGAVVHATGVIRDGQGWVFAGTHGAGKSTIASLVQNRPDCVLLNDDRVVVRRVDGDWRVFGTPWAGTVLTVSPASAPLAGILFLRHDAATSAIRLETGRAAVALLPRCFHPYWDRQALEGLLAMIVGLAQQVPCYDFSFIPDTSAILKALPDQG